MHNPPLEPQKPALHLQSDNSLLAAGASESTGHIKHLEADVAPTVVEYLPTPHEMQSAAPDAALYLPASQLAQVSPSGLEERE